MSGIDRYEITESGFEWHDVSDERFDKVGFSGMQFGVPRGLLPGVPVYVEGHQTLAIVSPLRIDGQVKPLVIPCLVLSLPSDRPTEGGRSYVIPFHDAHRVIENMRNTLRDGEKMHREEQRAFDRKVTGKSKLLRQADRLTRDVTRCATEGCGRTRSFFDEDGRGYCKRHADLLGIRPHGKVGG